MKVVAVVVVVVWRNTLFKTNSEMPLELTVKAAPVSLWVQGTERISPQSGMTPLQQMCTSSAAAMPMILP